MKKVVPPFLRTPYNYDMNAAGDESALHCEDQSLTQQHQAEETDINYIVKRYHLTGELPNRTMPPMVGDFTEAPDMQTAMDLVVAARLAFMQQPAEIRTKFNNDPVAFVDFCSDEGNRDEMRKMGLYSPEAAARFAQEDADRQALLEEGRAARAAQKAPEGPKGDKPKGVT